MRASADVAARVRTELAGDAAADGVCVAADADPRVRAELAGDAAANGVRVAAAAAPRVRAELVDNAATVGVRAAADVAARVRAELADDAAAVGVGVAADAAPRVRAEPADDAAAVGVRASVDVAASVRTGGGAAGTDLPAGTPFRPAPRPAGRGSCERRLAPGSMRAKRTTPEERVVGTGRRRSMTRGQAFWAGEGVYEPCEGRFEGPWRWRFRQSWFGRRNWSGTGATACRRGRTGCCQCCHRQRAKNDGVGNG